MTSELIISILAITVGFCALSISIWQGIETRKNYRLSVTPHLNVYYHWVKDENDPGIYLENKGVGPAVIKSIVKDIEGQKIDFLSNPKNLYDELGNIFNNNTPSNLCFLTLDPGTMISSGERIPFIWLNCKDLVNSQQNEILEFRKTLLKLSLKIEYTSVYGESFSESYIDPLLKITKINT